MDEGNRPTDGPVSQESELEDSILAPTHSVCQTTLISKTHRLTWFITNIDSLQEGAAITSKTFPQDTNCGQFYVKLVKSYDMNTPILTYSLFKCDEVDKKLLGALFNNHRPELVFYDGETEVEETFNNAQEVVIKMSSEWKRKFVRGKVLKVGCVVRDMSSVDPLNCSVPTEPFPERELRNDLKKLLDEGKHSDVELEVDGYRLKAHTLILSTRSTVFADMLTARPQATAVLKIPNAGFYYPVKDMLQFIYTGHCPVTSLSVEMLCLADKYGLAGLKRIVEIHLAETLANNNVLKRLAESLNYYANHLQQACVNYILSKNLSRMVTQSSEWNTLNEKLKFEIAMKLLHQ